MKKVLSIVLSLLLVVSNISLTYATHFCGGKAVESQLMIGAQDFSCGMIMPESTCENNDEDCPNSNQGEMETNCCDNDYMQLSVDDNYDTVSSIELPNLNFVVAFVHTYLSLDLSSDNSTQEYFNEAPPLRKQDIRVLHQVFRI